MTHDSSPQRHNYDETVVVDVDEQTQLLSEVVPHVITSSTDGRRHKMLADRSLTSCGQEWHAGLDSIVSETTWMSDSHLLCPDCYSAFERHKATAAHVEQKRRDTGEQPPLDIRDWTDLPSRKPRKRK